jgi:hypothetical protein
MTTKTLTISECISHAYADAAKKQDIASKGQMAAAAETKAFMTSLAASYPDYRSLELLPNREVIESTISGKVVGPRYNLLTSALKALKVNGGKLTWRQVQLAGVMKEVGDKVVRPSDMDIVTLLMSPRGNTYFTLSTK